MWRHHNAFGIGSTRQLSHTTLGRIALAAGHLGLRLINPRQLAQADNTIIDLDHTTPAALKHILREAARQANYKVVAERRDDFQGAAAGVAVKITLEARAALPPVQQRQALYLLEGGGPTSLATRKRLAGLPPTCPCGHPEASWQHHLWQCPDSSHPDARRDYLDQGLETAPPCLRLRGVLPLDHPWHATNPPQRRQASVAKLAGLQKYIVEVREHWHHHIQQDQRLQQHDPPEQEPDEQHEHRPLEQQHPVEAAAAALADDAAEAPDAPVPDMQPQEQQPHGPPPQPAQPPPHRSVLQQIREVPREEDREQAPPLPAPPHQAAAPAAAAATIPHRWEVHSQHSGTTYHRCSLCHRVARAAFHPSLDALGCPGVPLTNVQRATETRRVREAWRQQDGGHQEQQQAGHRLVRAEGGTHWACLLCGRSQPARWRAQIVRYPCRGHPAAHLQLFVDHMVQHHDPQRPDLAVPPMPD